MKSVSETLLQRRSIRRYEREPITDQQLNLIYEAIRNTPTSYNGQQFSVIDVSDQALKEEIYALTNQKQVKTCNRFLLFCADFHKIRLIAEAKGIEMPDFQHTLDGVIVGTVDAALAMMSALIAAEAQGLGTCCIGYARTAAPEALSRLLNLPQDTYVVCGLAIGVPREMPDLKPKQPIGVTIHSNRYSEEGLTDALLAYDAEITEYNATRSGTKSDNDWAGHIIGYYREAMAYRMLDAVRRRGFDVVS
ncbi:MAG: NADPH-dependent oxidoreductase [Bacteroides sp.]|nr:NADPH-dependent oxidoreductase [Barnesiella sp.]MBD5324757.1 NADPH-dependent oxidoreductase [Bacteroides sp.]MBD5331500.1 NADPH-dependent oxidoreductase [Bacteroides sp.]MDE7460643.1 nitroreductase family protein [Paramuribaculum sp.]